MTHLGILLLCFEFCLLQHVFSSCLAVKAPFKNIVVPALGVSAPSLRLPGRLGYRGWTGRPWGGYGNWAGYGGRSGYAKSAPVVGPFGGAGARSVAIDGDIPVAGNIGIGGEMPVAGAVKFGGKVTAAGMVTIEGTCACTCGCNAPFIY